MKQKGFAHIFLILFLLAGLAVGVYLVQQKTNIFPKASGPTVTTPTTSFELSPANSSDNYYNVGDLIPVNVRARSDISVANLFNAKITFDKDLLAVDNIYTDNSFVKNWVENTFDNNAGTISLVGGGPTPGYKTDNNSETGKYLLMAIIKFKVLKAGSASINLTDDSAIFSNADNINILVVKTGTTIKTGTGNNTPAPTTAIGMPPAIPMRLYGNVTVNGKTAGAGVTISAKINGQEFAHTSTDASGRYGYGSPEFQIPAERPETTAKEGGNKGDIIYLYVNGVAAQTTTFDNGKIERLDLSIPSGSTPLSPYMVGGTVMVNGKKAGAGVLVSAKIGGVEVGRTTTITREIGFGPDNDSSYILNIPEDDPATAVKEGGVNGDVIQFYANGVAATTIDYVTKGTTAIFKVGGNSNISLSVVNPTPTSAPNLISSTVDALKGLIGVNTPTLIPTAVPTSIPTPAAQVVSDCKPGTLGTGDANGDGKVDLQDMSILLSDFGKTSGFNQAIDMNGDCTINSLDFLLMRKILIEKGVIKG